MSTPGTEPTAAATETTEPAAKTAASYHPTAADYLMEELQAASVLSPFVHVTDYARAKPPRTTEEEDAATEAALDTAKAAYAAYLANDRAALDTLREMREQLDPTVRYDYDSYTKYMDKLETKERAAEKIQREYDSHSESVTKDRRHRREWARTLQARSEPATGNSVRITPADA